MKPIRIEERLRIGFVGRHDIKEGEELCYDYGVRDKDIDWLISDGRAMTHEPKPSPEPKPGPAQKKKANRIRLKCPLQGCLSQERKADGFVKLGQHLKQYHGIEDTAQRDKLCDDVRQVCNAINSIATIIIKLMLKVFWKNNF